jgi:signal transduction histidine kinase
MELLIAFSITIPLCITYFIINQRKLAKTYDEIDEILDMAINKNSNIPIDITKENRKSKLVHKAIQLVKSVNNEISSVVSEKETIQVFISDMSHQMKTPLASLTMYTDLLLEENVFGDVHQEFLLRMKSNTDKLQWMMNNLMKVSRLEIGAIIPIPASASLRQTILDSIGIIYNASEQKNIKVTLIDFNDVNVLHDRKWTGEAMVNVLENAVKYSNHGSEIVIKVETLTLFTKISFTNYGIGIDASEWNKIFHRFYRGKNVVGYEGAGLGLYLTKLILEMQGAYIMVDSKINNYTTFSIFLQNCKN